MSDLKEYQKLAEERFYEQMFAKADKAKADETRIKKSQAETRQLLEDYDKEHNIVIEGNNMFCRTDSKGRFIGF